MRFFTQILWVQNDHTQCLATKVTLFKYSINGDKYIGYNVRNSNLEILI